MKQKSRSRSTAKRRKPCAPLRKRQSDEWEFEVLFSTEIDGKKFNAMVMFHTKAFTELTTASSGQDMSWRTLCAIPIAQDAKNDSHVRLYGTHDDGGNLLAVAVRID